MGWEEKAIIIWCEKVEWKLCGESKLLLLNWQEEVEKEEEEEEEIMINH
mgnify:FL=1